MSSHRHVDTVFSLDGVYGKLFAAILLTLVAIVIAGGRGDSAAFESPEVKFADASPGGLSIVPASCPSSPHYAGECTIICVRNSGRSCRSDANNCGATSVGTIQCRGGCSASRPSNVPGIGNNCRSAENNCGDTNVGVWQCRGGKDRACSAERPANRKCDGPPSTRYNCNTSTKQCSPATGGAYGTLPSCLSACTDGPPASCGGTVPQGATPCDPNEGPGTWARVGNTCAGDTAATKCQYASPASTCGGNYPLGATLCDPNEGPGTWARAGATCASDTATKCQYAIASCVPTTIPQCINNQWCTRSCNPTKLNCTGECDVNGTKDMDISATPLTVRSGSKTTVTWSSANYLSCKVTENNPAIVDEWNTPDGTQESSAIEQKTVYTLICKDEYGVESAPESVTVNVIPIFIEQ